MPSRDEPLLLATASLGVESLSRLGILPGLEGRVVCEHEKTGACTVITDLPPAWRCERPVQSGRCDIFVIHGDVRAGDVHATTAGLLTLWGEEPVTLSSDRGARIMMFTEPSERPSTALEASAVATQAWERPWEMATTAGMPQGLLRRRLQREDIENDSSTGPARGWIRMIMLLPGWWSPDEERHVGCWEENIMLAGDVSHIGKGRMRSGDCLANPPDWWHGPMATKTGALIIVHCDAPMPVEYRPHPDGREALSRYLQDQPWIAGAPEHDPQW